MQVYRGMDIGTAKPSASTREEIPHHMVDVADPIDDFDVATFQRMARSVVDTASTDGVRLVIVGGSGLHFRSLVDPYSFSPTDLSIRERLEETPADELAERLVAIDSDAPTAIDLSNPRRVVRALETWELTGVKPSDRAASAEYQMIKNYVPLIPHVSIGFDAGDRAHAMANRRFDAMMDRGLLDEVRLLSPGLGRVAGQAVGYKELAPVVRDGAELTSAVENAKRATRGLIKRQRTFFRRDPRIQWMPWQDDSTQRAAAVTEMLERTTGWTS